MTIPIIFVSFGTEYFRTPSVEYFYYRIWIVRDVDNLPSIIDSVAVWCKGLRNIDFCQVANVSDSIFIDIFLTWVIGERTVV
ncbi:hypothetical protein D9M72_531640 [compost metagenome]